MSNPAVDLLVSIKAEYDQLIYTELNFSISSEKLDATARSS